MSKNTISYDEETPKKAKKGAIMKKVFSKEAYIKHNIRTFGELGENGKRSLEMWVPICEGKTAGEMLEMGYQAHEAWMIEVDDKE